MWQVKSTYKARDVEETLDVLFYRPVGYVLALGSATVGLTPNVVTIIGIIAGIIAGHLFFYTDLTINVVGAILLVFSEAMDSADGQLARMTNNRSRLGRVLDGFGTNLIFISIYFHLCLRFTIAGGGAWIYGIALMSAISHSFQAAMADLYRNAYLHFVYSDGRGELDTTETLAEKYRSFTWAEHPVQKFLMRIYLNYTYQQESVARSFRRLYAATKQLFDQATPEWFGQEYSRRNKPLLKYYNILTTNTRMIVLVASVFLDKVLWYLLFELIVLNLLLLVVTLYQQRLNLRLLEAVHQKART